MSKKGGSSGNQTVTQQNIPDWAMNYAQNTLDMGRYYTNNPNYRPSTLDRDYSGIRGYNAQGQPNSQVGQFGLNPRSYSPTTPVTNLDGTEVLEEEANLLESPVTQTDPYAAMDVRLGYGRDYDPSKVYSNEELVALATSPSGEHNPDTYQKLVAAQNSLKNYQAQQAQTQTNQTEAEAEAEAEAVPFGETLTPFQAFDRQRFAGPSEGTVRGEGILSGRYDQRFGAGGTDPFAAATTAVNKAAGYGSTYKGLMDSDSTLAQSGGYQT